MKLQFEKGHNKLREEVKLKVKEREQEIAELKSNFVKEREELKEKISSINREEMDSTINKLKNDIVILKNEKQELDTIQSTLKEELRARQLNNERLTKLLNNASKSAEEKSNEAKLEMERQFENIKHQQKKLNSEKELLNDKIEALQSKEESFNADKKELESLISIG